ncbi:uncharacterized protein LOC135842617 [Planococcus citri]|uniref:uncharacterized protein LOC135842617 n=1 Tax=Planococcus citri TaxID=170843 RepID=UPI0031F8CF16
MSNMMQFFRISFLIVAVLVLTTEAFPKKSDFVEELSSGSKYVNVDETIENNFQIADAEKKIVKRQVRPGATGPGQYGGTWNSQNGKTEVKAGVDFNRAPQLGWHADAKHQIYKNPSGKVTVDAFAGANQQFNQIGKSHPNVQGGVRVNFR